MKKIYNLLLKRFGPRGWWPLISKGGKAGYDDRGYHPGIYDLPPPKARFEIILGAVLTQNTNWRNVEKALLNLRAAGIGSPERLLELSHEALGELIRPSGYFNQKAKKLKETARFFLEKKRSLPSRDELLGIWGVGEETADSILLYAYNYPVFVVDAYTKRLFSRLGFISEKALYREVQDLFHRALKKDFVLYNEFHALIVEQAKIYCRKKPLCEGCPLESCPSRSS